MKGGITPMNTKQTLKGFTIIEVVLVLAIAGLIFLMVFVALPALQSGQRDTARKQDVGNLGTAINNYSSANRGKLPDNAAQLGEIKAEGDNTKYLTSISKNITEVKVSQRGSRTSIPVADGVIEMVKGARCGDVSTGTVGVTPGNTRQYVLVTRLEAGGGTGFCQDS